MTISESNELIFLYSLNRHLRENHKGVRPYACTLCDKKYGRRDYLQRHLKSHNANYAVNLQSASHINASQVVQKVQVQPQNTKSNTIILQQGQGGAIQVSLGFHKMTKEFSRKKFVKYEKLEFSVKSQYLF